MCVERCEFKVMNIWRVNYFISPLEVVIFFSVERRREEEDEKTTFVYTINFSSFIGSLMSTVGRGKK